MESSSRLAVVAIIIEEIDAYEQVNGVLHDMRDFVVGRMGIPYKHRNLSVISLVLDAPNDMINSLTGKLGMIKGISAKALYSNK